ncbi:MAG: response regulator transcription factor [Francisella endosymbiont of Hyalomma asiaticum]
MRYYDAYNESGLDFCKRICSQKGINIIIATASNDEIDQILAYEFGAKDYISKPFNRKLLLTKIKTNVNSSLIRSRYLFFDGVVFDTLEKTIKNKQDILYQLSNIEYKILLLLTEKFIVSLTATNFFKQFIIVLMMVTAEV